MRPGGTAEAMATVAQGSRETGQIPNQQVYETKKLWPSKDYTTTQLL